MSTVTYMGILMTILSALSFGLSNSFLGKSLKNTSVKVVAFWTLATSVLMSLVASMVIAFRSGLPVLTWDIVILYALSGVLGSGLGRWFTFAALNKIGPTLTSSIKVTIPMFTIILSVVFLGERPHLLTAVGVLGIIGGLYLLSREKLKSGSKASPAQDQMPRLSNHALYIVLGLCGALFYSLGDLTRKVAVGVLPSPLVGTLISATTSLVLFGSVLLWRGGLKGASVRKSEVWPLILAGVIITLAMWFFLAGLAWFPLSIASAIAATEPVFSYGAARLLKAEEKITPLGAVSLLAVIAGVVTIIFSQA